MMSWCCNLSWKYLDMYLSLSVTPAEWRITPQHRKLTRVSSAVQSSMVSPGSHAASKVVALSSRSRFKQSTSYTSLSLLSRSHGRSAHTEIGGSALQFLHQFFTPPGIN